MGITRVLLWTGGGHSRATRSVHNRSGAPSATDPQADTPCDLHGPGRSTDFTGPITTTEVLFFKKRITKKQGMWTTLRSRRAPARSAFASTPQPIRWATPEPGASGARIVLPLVPVQQVYHRCTPPTGRTYGTD